MSSESIAQPNSRHRFSRRTEPFVRLVEKICKICEKSNCKERINSLEVGTNQFYRIDIHKLCLRFIENGGQLTVDEHDAEQQALSFWNLLVDWDRLVSAGESSQEAWHKWLRCAAETIGPSRTKKMVGVLHARDASRRYKRKEYPVVFLQGADVEALRAAFSVPPDDSLNGEGPAPVTGPNSLKSRDPSWAMPKTIADAVYADWLSSHAQSAPASREPSRSRKSSEKRVHFDEGKVKVQPFARNSVLRPEEQEPPSTPSASSSVQSLALTPTASIDRIASPASTSIEAATSGVPSSAAVTASGPVSYVASSYDISLSSEPDPSKREQLKHKMGIVRLKRRAKALRNNIRIL